MWIEVEDGMYATPAIIPVREQGGLLLSARFPNTYYFRGCGKWLPGNRLPNTLWNYYS